MNKRSILRVILPAIALLGVFLLPVLVANYLSPDVQFLLQHRWIWYTYVALRFSLLIYVIVFIAKLNSNETVRSFINAILVIELVLTVLPYSMAGASFLRDNWVVFNYAPLNQQGFRDIPVQNDDGKQVVFIGDSFTAGFGVTRIEDRYDRVFARNTTAAYTTVNLGIPGSGTKKQFDALKDHSSTPNVVVYQYYVNDIDATVSVMGLDTLRPIDETFLQLTRSPWLTFSYIVNTLFWTVPNPWLNIDFNSYLDILWSREDIVEFHEKELQSIIDYCEFNKIPLFVIVFPDLADLERFKFVSDHVLNYFYDRGIPTMDVYELVKGCDKTDIVVNFQDSHPSIKTHALVGIKLAELMAEKDVKP